MAGNLTAMIAAAFSGSAAPPVTSDPYYEYTTLLLPGNGTNGAQNNTFLDSSTNNFTITRNGNTTQGTFSPFSQTGWGNYFNGSSSLATPATSQFSATGDFTISCWVYIPALSTGIIVSSWASTASDQWMLVHESNGFVFYVGTPQTLNAPNTAVTNQWMFLSVSRSGSALSMYANGSLIASNTSSATIGNPNQSILVGQRGFPGSPVYFTGYISDVRIVNGTAISGATVPTSPATAVSGTALLTCQSNRFRDASTNNFTITVNGSPSVQAFSPFNPSASWSAATYGGSGYFDGNGDYLSAASNAAFNLGTVFSVETFFYTTSTAKQVFFQLSGYVFYVESNKLTIWAPGSIGGTGTDVPINSWAHIVFTRDSSNQARAFVNGVLAWSASMTAASSQTIAYIGAENGSTNLVNGYMSNIRFVKGDIPTAYQTTSNTAGTTIFTPPTAPLTAITNTSLLLNYTNAGIYDATSKNDLETVGNAQISTAQSKWGGSSMAFNGSTSYLLAPASNLFDLGSADWTVEGWFYMSATGSYPAVWTLGNSNGDSHNLLCNGGTRDLYYFINGGVTAVLVTTISLSQWYHFAVVRSSGTTKIYLNGTQTGGTTANAPTSNNKKAQIGGTDYGSQYWNGYIQDLRITKGYARYTANFTAPTAAFPTL
jgi:hypothetical protein